MSVKKNENAKTMKSFGESDKSKKTVESMIITPGTQGKNPNNNNVATKKKSAKAQGSVTFSPKLRETIDLKENNGNSNESTDNNDELDIETRLANLAARGKKG